MSLVKSKKAKSAWIGALSVTIWTILAHKLGLPETLIKDVASGIGLLFVSQIGGQAGADIATAIKNKKETSNE